MLQSPAAHSPAAQRPHDVASSRSHYCGLDEVECSSSIMNVQEFQTRFIWPFAISHDRVDQVARLLGGMWEPRQSTSYYHGELLEQVRLFLRDDVSYYRCIGISQILPPSTKAVLKDVTVPFRTAHGAGVELFVTKEGICILSMTFSVTDVPTDVMLDFNYRLSRRAEAGPARLHVPHPSEDEARWAKISEDHRPKIRPSPLPNAPALEQIGAPGGTFTLADVIDHLIARPLAALQLKPIQPSCTVYTVASFGEDVTFDSDTCVSWGGPLLSALAQVEEPAHAGASAGGVAVPNCLMNRNHWAGVGVLGAAHLTAAQAPLRDGGEHPFNAERLVRIRDKYFIPYLLGLIQRHVLNSMATRAVELVRSRNVEGVRTLRTRLLEFGVGGRFSQVGFRHALHRYYRLVQEGLDLSEAWANVRVALTEIDASNIAIGVANNVGTMARLQHAAHTLEYVIVSVYAAKLWHMFGAENHSIYESVAAAVNPLLPRDRTLPHDWFVTWSVIGFAAIGWLGVYLYNRFNRIRL